MAAKFVFSAFALLIAAQSATAHTYFESEMVPFGDQAPDAPDASAYLDVMQHDNELHWQLNVTDVEEAASLRIMFGNPEIAAETVATLYKWATPFTGTAALEGVFNMTDAAPEYPWTAKGLAANAGLKFLWAVVTNPEDYRNVILSAPLAHYVPSGEH